MSMRSFKIVNRTKEQLEMMVSPRSVPGGNLQAIPWVLFDTQLYTSAVTTNLNYFQTVQGDRTLGNMQSGGQLPVDTWLEIQWMFITPIIPADSVLTGLIGAWGDLSALFVTGRPTHTLTIQDKDYGQLPVEFFGSAGGMEGEGFNEAAAGLVHQQFATWTKGCGFWVGGQIVLPPQAGFNTQLRWNAPVTLPSGNNINIRVSYLGTLHRPIL